jgi:CubicO group peptidase (beta-lactamase class C family)
MMKLVRRACALLVVISLSAAASAQSLTSPDPEGAGFSSERLARIAPWYQSQINAGALPGAVIAVARNGKLAYLKAIGTFDRAGKIPLTPDAIFWIASMTKPVTSVAAMMLVEEGKLDLAAPVSRYLPELKDMQVGVEKTDPATGTSELVLEAPKRPMEVIDLLRHTSGLVYPEEGTTTLHKAYRQVSTFRRDRTLAEFVAGLARMPLAHQPGEVWEYSWGVDVLARVVEVASGQDFDEFLQTRIFKPLGMVDTGFWVSEGKLARLVDPLLGGRPALWDVTKQARLFSGGGGLVSTAPDYLRFCQMLLNGGELDGARILAAKTVQQMTTNALPPDVRFAGIVGGFVGPKVGTSWGLGFAIRTNPEFSILPGAVGSFNWNGIWGTYFWIDPTEKLIAVQMIQVPPDTGFLYRDALRHLTYAALRAPEPVVPAASPPAVPVAVSADILVHYVGTYDFGASLSSRDKNAPIPAFAFSGIGLEVALVDGQVAVRTPYEDAPAAKAGVLAGDVLAEIDDVSVKGLSLFQVVDKLRGPAGTQVRLKVTRKGQDAPIDVTLVREVIRRPGARLQVRVADGQLVISATGPWSVFEFEKGKSVPVKATSITEFRVDGGDHTRLAFVRDATGKVSSLILNPGPWEIRAAKIN